MPEDDDPAPSSDAASPPEDQRSDPDAPEDDVDLADVADDTGDVGSDAGAETDTAGDAGTEAGYDDDAGNAEDAGDAGNAEDAGGSDVTALARAALAEVDEETADDEPGQPSREDASGRDRDGETSAPSGAGDAVPSGDAASAGDTSSSDDGDAASPDAANDGTYTPPTAQEGIAAQQAPATGNGQAGPAGTAPAESRDQREVPADVRKYDRFKKMDGAQYERVNQFLRDRTYITAREWAIARLCSDFRTETGVEMTKIGENLPELVPFMTDTYTPQAVNQARASFKDKVSKSGATFLYGAMSDFFTAEELDDMMYEVTEVAKFLLEVEGADLSVDEELEAEERISSVMRDVRQASADLRNGDAAAHSHDDDGHTCPNCGHEFEE